MPAHERAGTAWLPPTPFLADWLFVHAERTPDAPAVASPTVRLTYGGSRRPRPGPRRPPRRDWDSGPAAASSSPCRTVPPRSSRDSRSTRIGAISVEVSREWSGDVLGDVVERSGCRHAFIWARDAPEVEHVPAGRTSSGPGCSTTSRCRRGIGAALGRCPHGCFCRMGARPAPSVARRSAAARILDPDQAGPRAVHVRQHRATPRRDPDVPQHRCQQPVDRGRTSVSGRRRPGDADPARSPTATGGACCRPTCSWAGRSSSTTARPSRGRSWRRWQPKAARGLPASR